jgi:hypothetical protein
MKKIFYFLFLPGLTFAATPLATIPFGGPILAVASCDNGLLLVINKYFRFWPGFPPTLNEVGTYLFQYGLSRLIVGALVPTINTLGLALPGGVCLVPPAEPIPVMYTILFVGTGVVPSSIIPF